MQPPLGALLAAALAAHAATAQTITVDTVEDVTDFGGAQQVGDLPGPDGRVSFREAVAASNNTPGVQTIAFAIPRDDWWLVDTMAVLKLEDYAFVVRDTVEIDFTTQTTFTGDTNPDGTEVGIFGRDPNGYGDPAIILNASDCVVRGLGWLWYRGCSVEIGEGHRNRIVGCVTDGVEIDPGMYDKATLNVIGGTTPEDANVLDFVELFCGADDNIIVGNRIRTVRIEGYNFGHGYGHCYPLGNRIGGPTEEERNIIAGFGGFGAEGFPTGDGVLVMLAEDTLIEGNYIGLDEDGVTPIPGGVSGVEVADAVDTTIRGNVIAGMMMEGNNHYEGQFFGEAIRINSINFPHVGVVIEDNLIGTDASGENPILTLSGIRVNPVRLGEELSDIRIEGNVVAFTASTGVAVHYQAAGVEVTGNSIHSNDELGLDLSPAFGTDGVTPNDQGDADEEGGNEFQNFPVVTAATADGSVLRVRGTLSSHPALVYRIEVFANAACDPSGYGEGERFVGAFEVTTDAAGDAAFDEALAADVDAGAVVTATATDVAARQTSEFSACVEATEGACAADFNRDGHADTQDVLAFLNAWAAQDPGADFNSDGTIDSRDVLAFLNAWNAGCS